MLVLVLQREVTAEEPTFQDVVDAATDDADLSRVWVTYALGDRPPFSISRELIMDQALICDSLKRLPAHKKYTPKGRE